MNDWSDEETDDLAYADCPQLLQGREVESGRAAGLAVPGPMQRCGGERR